MTPFQVLVRICLHPKKYLIDRWHWKSALFSSVIRALIFFFSNLSAGWRAATGALLVEFAYRSVTCGFYGAITQAFKEAEPPWLALAVACFVLPVLSHSLELCVHLLRGTPKLFTSIVASVTFTIVSTLFMLYAMRRGSFVVGSEGRSLAHDAKQIPLIVAGFVWSGPRLVIDFFRRRGSIEFLGRWLAGVFSFQKSDVEPLN